MRIVCPNCFATYDVPDARLRPGRAVRCAKCGEDWAPTPLEPVAPPFADATEPVIDEPAAAEPPPPEPPPPALVRPSAMSAPPAAPRWTDDRLALAGWAASLVVLAALLWGGVAGRGAVMRAWPPSARLYAAIGLLQR